MVTHSKKQKAARPARKQSAKSKARPKKGFDPEPFLGKIKWGEDPMRIQQQMRYDWK
jgi:hypothetical protein